MRKELSLICSIYKIVDLFRHGRSHSVETAMTKSQETSRFNSGSSYTPGFKSPLARSYHMPY
jgi:hypothetical protein